MARRVLAFLFLAAGFLGCGGDDKLQACSSCRCDCGGGTTMTISSTPPPCECGPTCASACGRTPVSAQCIGPIEVDSCALGAQP
jgi:hypothetical protein